jgi:malonyl CoA-acyl carrier protein transacylase
MTTMVLAAYVTLAHLQPSRRPIGHLKTLPLFPSITEHTPLYTFTHPMGLLSATQFTQPAMVLYELAAFEDMKAHGLVPTGSLLYNFLRRDLFGFFLHVVKDAFFAGHSLGEFAALAAFGNFFPYDSLMDVVFYRGFARFLATTLYI